MSSSLIRSWKDSFSSLMWSLVSSLSSLITSLFRTRMKHNLWRGLHVSAYALWALAIGHGIGPQELRHVGEYLDYVVR